MNPKDLIAKLKSLEGLSHDEKSALIDLLNTKKKYGIVWEEKPEAVEAQLRTELPVLVEVPERRISRPPAPSEGGGGETKEATGKMPGDTRESTASFVIPEGELYSAQEAAQGGETAQTPFRDEKGPEGDKKEGDDKGPENADAAAVTLPLRERTRDGAAPNHILIEGDNLHALTALSFTHEGRVDVIYIDPPYNTGNKDFKYNDSFVDREDSYRHSKWISFMHKRLLLARRLLKDTGVIFISIDDNEQAQLKLLCDEVFGEENFISDVIWQSRKSVSNDTFISLNHNYTLIYARDMTLQRKENFRLPISSERFENLDNDPRGPWVADPFDAPNVRPNLTYPILNPNTNQEHLPPRGRCWRTTKEEYERLYDDNRIVFGKTGNTKPQLKRFLDFAQQRGATPISIWSDIETTTNGTQLLELILGEKLFTNPKPLELVTRILKLSTKTDRNYIVLDFFAGSGTTLHATMQLNAEDGGSRQCILVTNNESNICEEVTYERNKRVIQGYTNSKGVAVPGLGGNNLRYYRTAFVPAAKTEANKRALTAAATDLLCIKEDCYTEITGSEGFNPAQCRLFTNEAGRVLAVVYYSRRFAQTVAQLTAWIAGRGPGLPPAPSEGGGENPKLEKGGEDPKRSTPSPSGRVGEGPVRLYAFSPEKETLLEDFAPVADRVEAIPLPEAIYNAYRATFRSLKLDQKKAEAVAEDVVMQNELGL